MKLTEEQKKKFEEARGDHERILALYEGFIADRLFQLDPEFMNELEDLYKEYM